jgi:hypothetical protein
VTAGLNDDDDEAVDEVEGGWEYGGILAVVVIATDVLVGNTGVECEAVGRGGCERGRTVLGGLNEGEAGGEGVDIRVGDDIIETCSVLVARRSGGQTFNHRGKI